jgi:tRNA(Ile)-lysidine synthase
MNIILPEGKYVIAVSGGIDSVVLLDILAQQKNIELIVAHFDHGIRSESVLDAQFVAALADRLGLVYEIGEGNLGPNASEATARKVRYDFLEAVRQKYNASAIITAHHQDDVIETGMINLIRGTGRSGLTSLKNRQSVIRPLLGVSKEDIKSFAEQANIEWREDSSNTDPKYLRNHVRHLIVPKMSAKDRELWLQIIEEQKEINQNIDKEIELILKKGLHKGQLVLGRSWFCKLPHDVAREVIVYLLTKAHAREIDKKTVERLSVQIKTLPAGKLIQANGVDVLLTKRSARFKNR